MSTVQVSSNGSTHAVLTRNISKRTAYLVVPEGMWKVKFMPEVGPVQSAQVQEVMEGALWDEVPYGEIILYPV